MFGANIWSVLKATMQKRKGYLLLTGTSTVFSSQIFVLDARKARHDSIDLLLPISVSAECLER